MGLVHCVSMESHTHQAVSELLVTTICTWDRYDIDFAQSMSISVINLSSVQFDLMEEAVDDGSCDPSPFLKGH